MGNSDVRVLTSAGLTIRQDTGRIANAQGQTIALAPVNMAVLGVLLARSGQVVSRNDLFEAVWGNQIVGEDALTRSISDIRAELRTLSGTANLIETLPKRGYRWGAPVTETTDANQAEPEVVVEQAQRTSDRWRSMTGRLLLNAAALVALASILIGLINLFTRDLAPVVAVLPLSADISDRSLAAQVERELNLHLLQLDGVRILARSAIDSGPANPFPFFYNEFGARWIVEGDIQTHAGTSELTLALVDARTGIVIMRTAQAIDSGIDAALLRLDEAIGR